MATKSKDFTISDLSGGFNDSDPPTTLADNQCTVATNVDFFRAPCGARRMGCASITLPSSLSTKDAITFLHRHLPTTDQKDSQLWVFASTVGSSFQLAYKDATWHDVAFIDNPTNTNPFVYQFAAQTLHGKLFIAYKSDQDRLHVSVAGATVRRTGIAQPPAAPTAANAGSGSYVGKRYFRVRYIEKDADDVILRRSEPSETLTFSPSGSGAGATITRPAVVNEGETHWEIEGSIDNTLFYKFATLPIGTATSGTETTVFTVGYASTLYLGIPGVLSEDIGDYSLIPSGKFLLADEDRLLILSSFEDDDSASAVRWTPVHNDPGVGNDERIPVDTDNVLNLNGFEGGGITGGAGPIYGIIYIFKYSHIYKLRRTGQREQAYEAVCLSKTIGAIPGSIVEADDENGRPAIYFLDPKIGPMRLGNDGCLSAGYDINGTWNTVNLDATLVTARSVIHQDKHQIHWWLAVDDDDIPSVRLTLQVDVSRNTPDGIRLGWTKHTGLSSRAVSVIRYATNIESGDPRSLFLKPFIAVANDILMMDVGDDDNGEAFEPLLISRPYLLTGSVNNRFAVRAGSMIGDADTGAQVAMSLIRDFGIEESDPVNFSFTPVGSEDPVIAFADNLHMVGNKVFQIKLEDGPDNTAQWAVHRIDLVPSINESA